MAAPAAEHRPRPDRPGRVLRGARARRALSDTGLAGHRAGDASSDRVPRHADEGHVELLALRRGAARRSRGAAEPQVGHLHAGNGGDADLHVGRRPGHVPGVPGHRSRRPSDRAALLFGVRRADLADRSDRGAQHPQAGSGAGIAGSQDCRRKSVQRRCRRRRVHDPRDDRGRGGRTGRRDHGGGHRRRALCARGVRGRRPWSGSRLPRLSRDARDRRAQPRGLDHARARDGDLRRRVGDPRVGADRHGTRGAVHRQPRNAVRHERGNPRPCR